MHRPAYFLRHMPGDPAALHARIEQEWAKYVEPVASMDMDTMVERAGDLGVLLTNTRREAEAYELLAAYLAAGRATSNSEPSAWLLHALATAAQYLSKYGEADELLAEVLEMAKASGLNRLEHFVLHHWGRRLA